MSFPVIMLLLESYLAFSMTHNRLQVVSTLNILGVELRLDNTRAFQSDVLLLVGNLCFLGIIGSRMLFNLEDVVKKEEEDEPRAISDDIEFV